MNISVTNINEHEVQLQIKVDWTIVEEDYNTLLKRYAKIPVKGFRGAPPVKMVVSLYKKQLCNDLAAACSEKWCRKALQSEQLVAGSPVSITDMVYEPEKEFGFGAQFLKMPDFELPDYHHLNLTAETHEEKLTEISNKLLERTVINIPEAFIEKELQYSETENGAITGKARSAAIDRIKLMLILKKIATNDGIETDERDVEERIQKVAEENDMSITEVKEFLLSNGGLSRLSDLLLAENVLNYLVVSTPLSAHR